MNTQLMYTDLQIENLTRMLERATDSAERVKLECALAKRYEETGDYEAAREIMESAWRAMGKYPQAKDSGIYISALVLLRVGALTGYLGGGGNGENVQERARELIGESLMIFEARDFDLEAIEAQYEMALCYLRDDSLDKARAMLQTGLIRFARLKSENTEEFHARLLLREAIVEFSAQYYEKALQFFETARPLFADLSDHLLRGKFHSELAATLRDFAASLASNAERRQEYLNSAAVEFETASSHFEQAGHIGYCARVENDLALFHLQLKHYADAHAHVDRAEKMLKEFKDTAALSGMKETRARILLGEEKFDDAIALARKASDGFLRAGEQGQAAQAMATEGAALARRGDEAAADAVFQRAIELAETVEDLETAGRAALMMLEELAGYLTIRRAFELFERADDLLSETTNVGLIAKVRVIGRHLARRMHAELSTSSAILSTIATGETPYETDIEENPVSFADAVQQLEAKMIERAMAKSENQVTRAAKLLGVSHQHLSLLLRTRHKHLFYLVRQMTNPFKPRKRRRQNIMKSE